jgi:hypothetical protein
MKLSGMDSVFFHAYNSCDINKQALIYGESLEFFYHDRWFDNTKQEILDE